MAWPTWRNRDVQPEYKGGVHMFTDDDINSMSKRIRALEDRPTPIATAVRKGECFDEGLSFRGEVVVFGKTIWVGPVHSVRSITEEIEKRSSVDRMSTHTYTRSTWEMALEVAQDRARTDADTAVRTALVQLFIGGAA